MFFLNTCELKALIVEPNRIELIVLFQSFCNTDHDQDALIPLHQIFLFVWLMFVRTVVNVPFSNAALFLSESRFWRIELA